LELGISMTTLPLDEDAKMPACGMEGRGNIVAKRLVVMTKTR
jgi:hypothetical protein